MRARCCLADAVGEALQASGRRPNAATASRAAAAHISHTAQMTGGSAVSTMAISSAASVSSVRRAAFSQYGNATPAVCIDRVP
ncbi:MAG: hypothetical protein ACLUFK_07350 [Oscillospiraceae bacterium]